MSKFNFILMLSFALSAMLFFAVRFRQTAQTNAVHSSTITDAEAKPTSRAVAGVASVSRKTECLGKLPYTIVPLKDTFILCGRESGGDGNMSDVVLSCPPGTALDLHPLHRIATGGAALSSPPSFATSCRPIDLCAHAPDGTQVEAEDALNLPRNRRYHICLGGRIHKTKVCPDNLPFFDKGLKRCVESDACTYLEDGTTFSDPQDDTAFFQCLNRESVRRSCPLDHTFFVTHCVPRDVCRDQEHGTKWPDPSDQNAYFKCNKGRAVKRSCAANEYFSPVKRVCTPYNRCYGRPGGVIPIPSPFLKRTDTAIQCDDREVATRLYCNRADDTARTITTNTTTTTTLEEEEEGAGVVEGEIPKHPVRFTNPSIVAGYRVYDETIRECRLLDLCLDLKPGKRYPLNDHSFLSCDHPIQPQIVDDTLKMNTITGDVTGRCNSLIDGTQLSSHGRSQPPYSDTYVVCSHQEATVQRCPPDHRFIDGICQFSPCMGDLSGTLRTGRVPNKSNTFYYCKRGSNYTFTFECPVGTTVSWPGVSSGRKLPRCEDAADPSSSAVALVAPKLTSPFSFTDARGVAHTCRGERIFLDKDMKAVVIPQAVNPWLFRCQDAPCVNSYMNGFAFVPADERKGAACVEGQVQEMIDCGPDRWFNLVKTVTGDFVLPDCVSDRSALSMVDKFSKIMRGDSVVYFDQSKNYAVDGDDFMHVPELLVKSEIVQEGIEHIVGPQNLENPDRVHLTGTQDCTKKANRVNVTGYPNRYFDCRARTYIRLRDKEVNVGWRAGSRIFPVFSKCDLFAVGTSTSWTSGNHRVFRCPPERPIFNYLRKRCENDPPRTHLLCEDAYFENFETYVNPLTMKLPEP